MVSILFLILTVASNAQDAPPPLPNAEVAPAAAASVPTTASKVASAPLPGTTLTLEQFVQQGGPILWVIIALAFVACVMTLYYAMTITPGRESPQKLLKRAKEQVRAGDVRGAFQMCEGRRELLAKVLYAGLRMAEHERYVIQEAMESEGERGATELWQKISYLNNIGVIAPLLGLLGTVWGMIGAFNSIAADAARVKSVTMAFYVSQAMITTAGGLLLGIPVLMAYYYFRGRVVKIVSRIEAQASEFVELLVRNQHS
ncbi:MAG: MotA/TolQ/ExbB proton channel family protein [Candidatus Hydrogenedentota bacterium]